MASVMAIGSEVFGSCVGEIDVSVGMENRGIWLYCGRNIRGYLEQGKRLTISGRGGKCYQVLEGLLGAFGLIEELKSPCCGSL